MGKGGGSPAPAPSQQTVTQTSIPEYARPYVENMLGKSEALTDINANPYQAYGGQRIQDFTPMQQQAFQGIGNMQVAPEIGAGSNLAALSGLGSIGAGGNYMNMATDPRSIQQFMSPYMQNVVDVQKQEAMRDYQKGLGGLNARAVASGAFGGTRAALERSEAGRNLNNQLANIQAQGSQNAFQAAQQAQQFGSSLGMQGFGQGLQAASTLGQLGQTGFGQRMGILGEQQKVGAVQQAQGQQALDTAYQDFLKQKNYPYQQLAYMSDMLRGLPLSQSAQQVYTAPPNVASQLGGLGMAGLGIYGMSGGFKGAKEGGQIKGYKEGGSIGYLSGGEVEMMSTQQLEQLLASPNLNPLELEMIEKALIARKRMEMNPQAGEMMARSGIGSISTGDMVPDEMTMAANGGIIAFSGKDSSAVKLPEDYEARRKRLSEREEELLSKIDKYDFSKSEAAQKQTESDISEGRYQLPYRALTAAGFAGMRGSPDASQRGNLLSNIGYMGESGLGEYGRGLGQIAADKKQLLQQATELDKTRYGKDIQRLGGIQSAINQLDTKQIGLMNARNSAGILAADKDRTLRTQVERTYLEAINKEKNVLKVTQKYSELTDDQLEEMAKKNVENRLTPNQKKIIFGGDEAKIPDATVSSPALTPKNSSVKSPLVLPKSAKEAVVGEIYNTKRGPAQWDGKQFILVQ
jgi:hypothetical protein